MPPRRVPVIPSLEIYTDEGLPKNQNEQLPPDSTRYQLVETLIHLALCLLESRKGRESLENTAIRIIQARDSSRVPHLYNRPIDEMPLWIDHFLRAMRSNFPLTYLTKMEGEAAVTRESGINDMARFDPKTCGYMDINRMIVNNMIFCRQERNSGSNYDRFKFQMGISIAHEIVHYLTGFLTGELSYRSHTPPAVTLQSYTSGRRGEAGRYWEQYLLDGVTEFYYDEADPMGRRQAGIPYLLDHGHATSPARPISLNYIDSFLRGNFTFPIRTSSSGQTTTRAVLRTTTREMTNVRWPNRNPPVNTSPPRDDPAGFAFRRLPRENLVEDYFETRGSSSRGYR